MFKDKNPNTPAAPPENKIKSTIGPPQQNNIATMAQGAKLATVFFEVVLISFFTGSSIKLSKVKILLSIESR